jgi:ATP-binding cassette subfamily F protein uup
MTLLLSLEDICLNMGGKPLFQDTTLYIGEGEKICLVGRNGAGKTTLMRLLMGEMEPDTGKRTLYPGMRIGYLAQQVAFDPSETVASFVRAGLAGDEYRDYLVDMVMDPLDLRPSALLGSLSGGQLRRAALAQSLVDAPDLLMLDEPTNHLDLGAIAWLEDYIAGYAGAILCVSHDRAFLKAISQKTLWIDRGQVRTLNRGYTHFDDWMQGILDQEARTLQNMEKKLEQEVAWTQGGITGRRKRNQKRMDNLHALRAKLKADKAAFRQTIRTVALDPLPAGDVSKLMIECKGVSHGFTHDDHTQMMMKDFHFRLMRGDRIGLLGKNGSGKSTFLKILLGQMTPDSGHIRRAKTLEPAYFDQSRSDLDPSKSLWETLCPDGGDYISVGGSLRHVCGYLKDFLFDPKQARDAVSTLSGGQQNRLMLAKVLANPGNLLILDEPTNDLDMDTLDRLQDILTNYEGTLLLVSHDRDFLDNTVTKVLAFEGEGVIEGYMGGYTDYLEQKAQKTGQKPTAKAKAQAKIQSTAPAPVTFEKKPDPLPFALKKELEQLPKTIAKLEKTIEKLHEDLALPDLYTTDPARFDDLAKDLQKAEGDLEKAEVRWLELEEKRGI